MEENLSHGLTLAEHRERIAAARSSLSALGEVMWQTPSGGGPDGLAGLLSEVDALGMACDAGRVAVVGEAMERGETSGGPAAMTTVQWVRHHAPSTRAGGAGAIVSVAQAFQKRVNAPVKEAVDTGRLPVTSAAAVVSEFEKLRPLLAEGAEPHVLEGLVGLAAEQGPRACRQLRPAMLARYGLTDVLQDQQNLGKAFISLSQPRDTGAETFEYRLTLDVEGKAVLEAALGPLSAPKPVDGERDLRSSDRRRGDALVTLVRRAVAAGDEVGETNKTTLLLTMSYDDLKAGLGAATTLGGLDAGMHLAPETVRRLCCDGSVIPIVLNGKGEVMDWGLEKRYFTDAQTKRLWLRDGGCTYPGCDPPPQWADAHHLVHWADLGLSHLGNAALLCERHHTIVHNRRHAGRVVRDAHGERVEWDLTRGSYDELLARRAACNTETEPA
ncbi:HNH endonuclease signature motif containing protein [Knoellia sp. 3-2P3]|uniref:HNH endonuclease signature motif containing protein n=1 Tax=unclassified Knoellia TaxID=2618719 RepID=UPI0023DA1E3E|nr:HNH endonuclease signature motif containing protein [Knoellia sp. 3-2P3]MDF2093061.1 HNH endonuclease signature motif containing protein [Knoellia sp. 3-2P3]